MFYTPYTDGFDSDQAVCCCAECGCEIYADDTIYLIDGEPICEECLPEFAEGYFAAQRMTGLRLLECSQY
ncbi:MAG: hypothetical protein SOW00_05680 [Oscillospiraceae bacterium]|nr:hypothetical protein [Eubacteriales bacterium]MDY2618270.1 hypothetical protein [Oscillospiraceae bacterium]